MARSMPAGAAGAPVLALEAPTGWKSASTVALVMIGIIAVRLHEFIPRAELAQPALLVTFGGLGILWARSSAAARTVVLRHPLVRLVFVYWAFMALTIPFALWPGLAFNSTRYFMPGVALLLGMLLCPPNSRTLFKLQVGFVAAVTIYALYAKVMGRVIADGRLSAGAGMYDSNDMAAMLGMALPLALGVTRKYRGIWRAGAIGAAVLIGLVVLASGSRGGMLGLVAGAIVFTLGMKGSRRIAAVIILACVTAATWTFSSDFQTRMLTLTNLESDYNTFDEWGRKEVWKRGRMYIRENPVIGVGAGNFPIAEGNYLGALYAGTKGSKWSNAHNSYIQAYAELGVVGGTLFVSILVLGAWLAFRLWRGVRLTGSAMLHRPELLASLCAYLVSATFLSHAYFMPLVTVLGLIALADYERKVALRRRRAAPRPVAGAETGPVPQPLAGTASAGFRYRGGLA